MATGLKDLKALQEALKKESADAFAQTTAETPLHRCTEVGWAEGVTALVKAGANINKTNERGDTPLIAAVVFRKKNVVEALIDLGADLEIANAIGSTPANYACRLTAGASVSSESYVIEGGVKRIVATTTADEMRTDRLKIMKVLLARGAKADVEDNNGFTALTYAVQNGALDFAAALLAAGADVSHKNGKSYEPIHAAAGAGDVDMVRWLLDSGASASARDSGGFTPLHDAAASGNELLVRLLLEHGAKTDAKIEEGWQELATGMTPADVAKVKGHTALVALLAPADR